MTLNSLFKMKSLLSLFNFHVNRLSMIAVEMIAVNFHMKRWSPPMLILGGDWQLLLRWLLLRWSLLTFVWKVITSYVDPGGGVIDDCCWDDCCWDNCCWGNHCWDDQQLTFTWKGNHLMCWSGGGLMITVEGIDSQLSLVHETEWLFMFTPHLMISTLLLQYEWHNLCILCNSSTSMWEMSCVHMSINVHIHMSSFQCDACLHVISMFKRISGTKLKSLVDRGNFVFNLSPGDRMITETVQEWTVPTCLVHFDLLDVDQGHKPPSM